MVGALERRGVRHGLALAATITIVLAVVFLAALIASLSIGELVLQLPQYESRLDAALEDLRGRLVQLGIAADTAAVTALISPERIFAFVQPLASAASEAGGALLVVAFTMIYAVGGGASFRSRAAAAFGAQHPLVLGLDQFGTDLRRYLLVRTQLGLFAAVLTLALLVALGVPLPVLWAVLVFISSFIPNIGAVIALIPPTILAYLHGGPEVALLVIVGYGVINFVQDQFLQPLVMGSELNLSPLVVFIAVIAWAWILGPAGALLAVPLTVGLVGVLEAFPSSRRLASLMRSRTEAESAAQS
jgi:predicted PurR-regulated permease PerM